MYHNAGAKVKGLATTITVLLMIGAVIGGFVIMGAFESFLAGLFFIAIGCLAAWLSGLMLAAFGELVENTYHIRKMMSEGGAPVRTETVKTVYADVSVPPVTNTNTNTNTNNATCPNCGSPRKGNSAFCGFCGTRL